MPNAQDIVNEFASLIVGQSQLPQGDPRQAYITIANICLEEFVGSTLYAYEKGLLPAKDEGQFKEGSEFTPLHEVKGE